MLVWNLLENRWQSLSFLDIINTKYCDSTFTYTGPANPPNDTMGFTFYSFLHRRKQWGSYSCFVFLRDRTRFLYQVYLISKPTFFITVLSFTWTFWKGSISDHTFLLRRWNQVQLQNQLTVDKVISVCTLLQTSAYQLVDNEDINRVN